MIDSRTGETPREGTARALGVAVVVTSLAALVVRLAPAGWRGTAVGAVFLAATYVRVWRFDDGRVIRAGLGFAGLVAEPDREPDAPRGKAGWPVAMLRSTAWAAGACLLTFVPFYFGWRATWHVAPSRHFVWPAAPWIARIAAGQLIGVALPEEAFYRGYLQSSLTEAFGEAPPAFLGVSWRAWGAIVVTSGVFALGHVATLPYASRLAVFFPSLAFGFLRRRTGGIGASMTFHAACNAFSEILGAGYGLY